MSAEYAYLIGTEGPFARRFLEPHELSMQARVGGFHVFHKEDLRRIAPLWLEFTRSVRAFAHEEPEAYFSESFLQARLLAAHLRTYSWVCTFFECWLSVHVSVRAGCARSRSRFSAC